MNPLEERIKVLEDRLNTLEKSDRYIFWKTVIFKGRIAFFGKAPVGQQLKASHNGWASLSDVVNALVNTGLFDQL